MNLLTSYDWLNEYVDLGGMTPEDFAARVSLSGPGVERLHPQGKEWNKVVLGHVLEVKPHPNADKLRLAITDIGNKKATIVCGGSNLAADQWVAVALEGAMVRWHGEGDLIELQPAEIRGVKSEGMICAANEIGLYDAFPHGEREILDIGIALPGLKLKPGTPLADVLGLSGDTVMDIEVTTNRVDSFSMVGMAREAAAILNKKLTWIPTKLPKPGKAKLHASVQDKKLCPRYMAVKINGVKVGPSPWWLKRRLMSAGLRPINNLVDITNFVMLELGQPMHAFDGAKLEGAKIVVRKAKQGERMAALDGKTYDLKEGMLVIADATRPQAVAGVMGSETSAVSGDTEVVIFEAATFDEISVRRTARALNLYSDSQLRFEKGLSTEAPEQALARAIELCLELCGGEVTSEIFDSRTAKYNPAQFSITFAKINELIGVAIKPKEAVDTLKRLGFAVKADAKKLTATVPWWRDHDIEDGRDLVEEIARVYGYANVPAVFPAGISPIPPSRELRLEEKVRGIARAAGYTETMTYSFTSAAMQEKAGYDPSVMLRIANPLTGDFEFMRTSLLPSLLSVVEENRERERTQKLFELQRVYYPQKGKLPLEQTELGVAVLGDRAWREAKGLVEAVIDGLGIDGVTWKRPEDDSFWHPGRSVQAWHEGVLLATVGELHPNLAQGYGFEHRIALADMPLMDVFPVARETHRYVPLPVYPQPMRDLALVVNRDVEAQDLMRVLRDADPLVRNVEWFDTYEGKGIEHGKKSLAFHVTLGADKTLSTEEVDAAMETLRAKAQRDFKASVRA
ncbi:MAG TPA: phenylalanine--tRNA ligase subunit beta [Verrucomicrobiae bacterium]|nr:phenylalanine--tRNA ligase subunit beta [Verrucomicrobiae bacterium]